MSYLARVIADSISPQGCRITTIEATYPRIIHAEMMTHRMFARNSASTRAIALSAQLKNLLYNPFIPEKFGINMRGMQSWEFLEGVKYEEAERIWLDGRDRALTTFLELILGKEVMSELFDYDAYALNEYVTGDELKAQFDDLLKLIPKTDEPFDPESTTMLNVHKQLAGRGLEAYMWHTVVITATEFDNFFALRVHPDAQGEIATIARMMKEEMEKSTPKELGYGEWHLPYIDEGEFDNVDDAIRASVSRTAATSFNRQNVKNAPRQVALYDELLEKGHMSPFEHQATPFTHDEWLLREELCHQVELITDSRGLAVSNLAQHQLQDQLEFSGNLRGWVSHRKLIPGEDNYAKLSTH